MSPTRMTVLAGFSWGHLLFLFLKKPFLVYFLFCSVFLKDPSYYFNFQCYQPEYPLMTCAEDQMREVENLCGVLYSMIYGLIPRVSISVKMIHSLC